MTTKQSSTVDDSRRTHISISSYGAPDKRLFSRWISVSYILCCDALFLLASLSPLILLLLLVGVYLKWMIPRIIFALLATTIAIDFSIPLPDGSQPNQKLNKTLHRIGAEGMEAYCPLKTICVPSKLSKDMSYY